MIGIIRDALAFRNVVLAIAMLAWAGPAAPATTKLTIIAGIPPTALSVKVTKEFFIPEINKRLAASGIDFKIEWTEAWSATVAKLPEVFSTVAEGVAHVGVQVWAFEGSKLPLESITFNVPFGISDEVALTRVMRTLHDTIPEMNEQFARNNHEHLVSWSTDPDQLITKFPVTRLESLKGRKIGASGTQAQYFRNTGAVAVSSGMDQAMEAMRSGLYEGYPAPVSLMIPYNMHESGTHLTKVRFGATISSGLSMNKKAFDALPAHAKKIFKEVAWEAGLLHAKTARERSIAFEAAIKKKGLAVTELSAEERKRWASAMPNVAKEWAQRTDARGLPGTRLVKAYMDELRKIPGADKEIARHWDRE
ncbi:MAG: TRAP transporter substrate-binding protein DctP [Betaproteobacteria bacterium]|nr:TRAP transporter substrate-binding protein DctP [Betaproteobacteria bacterium]